MTCPRCDVGGGECVFPYYGLAPHTHDLSARSYIGSTRILPQTEWPENFEGSDDEEEEGYGVYTHCLDCGDGLPVNERKAN